MAVPCTGGLPPTLSLALALTPTLAPTLTLTLTLSRRDDLVAPSRAILKEGLTLTLTLTLTLPLTLTLNLTPTLALTLTLTLNPNPSPTQEGALTKMRRHKWASQQCHRSPRQVLLRSALLAVHSP